MIERAHAYLNWVVREDFSGKVACNLCYDLNDNKETLCKDLEERHARRRKQLWQRPNEKKTLAHQRNKERPAWLNSSRRGKGEAKLCEASQARGGSWAFILKATGSH